MHASIFPCWWDYPCSLYEKLKKKLANHIKFYLFAGKDICKSVNHGCEHACVNAGDTFVCKCQEGFLLREDGKTCRSK